MIRRKLPNFGRRNRVKAPISNGSASISGLKDAAPIEPSGLSLVPLSSVPYRSIIWRWPKRIARGIVTVIAGHQKAGKSLVVCNIAATITRGGRFPAGEGEAKRGHVVIINNEDDAGQILRPRIAAAGGDLKRIHVIKGQANLSATNLIEELEPKIATIKNLRALILDPITSFVALNRNSADHVRSVLTALGALAARRNIAVIVVVHLNKGSGGRAMSRISGSFEWTAASRAAFLIVDEVGTDRHLFVPMANNVGLKPEALAFRVKETKDAKRVPTIEWDDDLIAVSADDALAAATGRVAETSTTDEAMNLIRQAINGRKSIRATELFKAGQQHGFSRKIIRRAVAKLGCKPKKKGFGAAGYWVYRAAAPIASSTRSGEQKPLAAAKARSKVSR
jgi:putative DNA primase/helicase